jgi:hypothetical protein
MRASLVTVASASIAAMVTVFLVGFSLSDAAKAQDTLERFDRAPTNAFSFRCDFRRSAPIDPIVHPGEYGTSHQHIFFGGRVKKDSTYQQLRNDDTTCAKEFHKTGYWVPELYRNGESVPVADVQTYYRSIQGTPTADLEPLPRGVKIIAGSGKSTGAQYGYVDWGCGLAPGTTAPDGRMDGFLSPVDCDPDSSNPYVKAVIHFPTCWTGAKDSADHKSHAAYPVGYPEDPAAWRCPEGYPVRTPRPDLSIRWRTSNGDNLKLSSGSIYSMHADIFEASNQADFQRFIDTRL